MVIEQFLMNLKAYCEEQHGSCVGCQYATDRDDDYRCKIQQITGTYPDTWKKLKEGGRLYDQPYNKGS